MASLFNDLGGQDVLRSIIDDFVNRIFGDVMIGYLFAKVSRERVKAKEYEFAAQHLGAEVTYTGRPLADAHRQHRIMGGQFMRRLQILKEVLADHGVPQHVTEHWVAHTLSLRDQVTHDPGGHCTHAPSAASGGRS